MDPETFTHVSLSVASMIYIITAFINTIYQLHISREKELKNLTDEAVNYVWQTYVKEIHKTDNWDNFTKSESENRAIMYIKNRMNCISCVSSDMRLRTWIRNSVENKKKKIYMYKNNIELKEI